jgi:hypothetical protein
MIVMKRIKMDPEEHEAYPIEKYSNASNSANTFAEVRAFEPDKQSQRAGKKVDGVELAKPMPPPHVLLITDHVNNYKSDDQGNWPSSLYTHIPAIADKALAKLETLKPGVFTIDGKKNINALDVIVHTPANVRGHNEEKFEKVTFIREHGRLCESVTTPRQELKRDKAVELLGKETFLENRRIYPPHEPERRSPGGHPGPGHDNLAQHSFPDRNRHRAQLDQGVDQEI